MKCSKLCAALLLLACSSRLAGGADEWLREIEIKTEPEVGGQQDFTVRIMPTHTHECQRVVFECVYQQKFPWTDTSRRRYIKVHEPVRFTYRLKDVRLVNDLDKYISFRVPISLDRLVRAYGEKVFNHEYPVTVARLVMQGIAEGETPVWSFELPVPGQYVVKDVLELKAKRASGKREEDLGELENWDILK